MMERAKKAFMAILVVSLFIFANPCCMTAVQADERSVGLENEQIAQLLNNQFDALRSADTGTLKCLFAGEMYTKNRALLEQNAEYPDFLRNHYQGAVFTITDIMPYNNDVLSIITVLLANGREQSIKLLLGKRAVDSCQNHSELSSPDVDPKRWVILNHIQDR